MKKFLSLLAIVLFLYSSAQSRTKNYDKIMSSRSIYEIDAFLRDANEKDPRRNILKNRVIDLMKRYIADAYPEDQNVKVFQEKLALLQKRPSTKISFEEMSDAIKKKRRKMYEQQLAELNNPTIAPSKSTSSTTPQVAYTSGKTKVLSSGSSTSVANTGTNTVNIEASSALSKSEEAEFNMLMNDSPIEHKAKTVQLLNKLFDNDPSSKDCIVMIQNKSDCNMIMRIEGVGNTKYRLAIAANNENSVVVQKGDYLFSSMVCGAQYASQKTVQKAMMVSLKNPGN